MGENTKIEWARHTWNPWMGCSNVSPACDHCYAEAMMDHRLGRVEWGGDRKRTSAATWRAPLKWDLEAAKAGERHTVFCLSLGDIWDNEVDEIWRHEAFEVMESTPNLIYLLLSKRIGNAVRMTDVFAGLPRLPGNAALGATMVNQSEWDRDLPKLKDAADRRGALFTFASVEPMLGPIRSAGNLPDWVIVGGESGHNARPMSIQWARSLREQCATAGVPYLFKQWGEWSPAGAHRDGDPGHFAFGDYEYDETLFIQVEGYPRQFTMFGSRARMERVGKIRAGRHLDGVEHNGFPAKRSNPSQSPATGDQT